MLLNVYAQLVPMMMANLIIVHSVIKNAKPAKMLQHVRLVLMIADQVQIVSVILVHMNNLVV
jgi:hypothetical protein